MKDLKNIFIVEDDLGDQKLLKKAIHYLVEEIEITAFEDGESALNKLLLLSNTKEFPDIILLDLNLPKIDGIELLKILKKHNQLRIIPIIIITTSNAPEDITQSYKNYCSGYIRKPNEYSILVENLRNALNFWFKSCLLPIN